MKQTKDRATSPSYIAAMFSRIAPRYDLLNTLLSWGRDEYWRQRAIDELSPAAGEVLLDLCCGTAEMSLKAVERGSPHGMVVGVDISRPMLRIARSKIEQRQGAISLLQGETTALPFADGVVDRVMVGFGLRNITRLPETLREVNRVLKTGGKLMVLEFSSPKPWLRGIYFLYLRAWAPLLAFFLSSDHRAYSYLCASIKRFDRAELLQQMERTGFAAEKVLPLSWGIVTIYLCRKTSHSQLQNAGMPGIG